MRAKVQSWILPILLMVVAPGLHATSSLDSSVIGMFPKDVSEFGYADLKDARQFSWFAQFESQLVPVSLYSFDQFLEAAQMKQTSSIDQIAWGRVSPHSTDATGAVTGGGQLVAVAGGDFDLDAIKTFLTSGKVQAVQVDGNAIYPSGTGSGQSDIFFALLDDQTIAFGPFDSLKRILEIRNGGEESLLANATMTDLIDEANGEGIFWGVLGSGGAGPAFQQLIPEASAFPQAKELFGKMNEVLVTLKVSSDFELDFQGATASSDDAVLLSQLLQAGLLYRQYEVMQTNPDLAKILGGISVASNGVRLSLSISLTDDQVLSLIEHNTFSPSS
jgi:hypothetical protein